MLQPKTLKETALRLVQEDHTWRCIIAVTAIAAMMLPWVYLDGARSPLTGADLIAYTFTGPERGAMVRQSVPGALALMVTPMLTLTMSVLVFARIYQQRQPLVLMAVTAFLPGLVLLFAGGITSSDRLMGPGIATPQIGIILGFICQVILAVHVLTGPGRDEEKQPATEPATNEPGFEPAPFHRMEDPDSPRLREQPPNVPAPPLRQPGPVSHNKGQTAPLLNAPQPRELDEQMPVRAITQPGHANWRPDPNNASRRKHGRTRRQDQRRNHDGT